MLLLAHGSRDPRAAAATRALAQAVAEARPWLSVRHAFLELSQPLAGPVLRQLAAAGPPDVVVAPLLLTEAYHSRVDVPGVLERAAQQWPGLAARPAGVLGPDPRLLDAALRRLTATIAPAELDAVVLAAAGSSAPDARASVRGVAQALSVRLGRPVSAGFASAAPSVAEAMSTLRASGAERIGVASYFLAPGLLHDRVIAAAQDAGAAAVGDPMGAAPELVDVVLSRYDAVSASEAFDRKAA
ncbi:MAG: sirohydrochlorin chelatase [Micromonosporaceae bacterium]